MADVQHIQIDNTPTTWQPNAIYFVRNTGQIWQTDSNGVAVLMSVTTRSQINVYEVTSLPATTTPETIYIDYNEGEIWYTDVQNSARLVGVAFTGYNELKQELKSTVQVTGTDIDWAQGVAFQVPELTADTTFTFSNVQENKQIKIYLKGNFAFSFPANVDVSNVNYDGAVWNVIALEAMNINGSQIIKAYII